MRLLFVHQNFPGQFKHLIKKFAATSGYEVACIGETDNMLRWDGCPGVRIHGYGQVRRSKEPAHPYLHDLDQFVRRGQAAAKVSLEIKKSGFEPDVIVAHTGWGEALYLRDIFPHSKILSYSEFYYNADGSDIAFEKRGGISLDKRLSTRTRNFNQALSFVSGDWGMSPTEWQKKQYPEAMRDRISVVHDGIDTELIKPDPEASCVLRSGNMRIKAGDEVVTFVNRNFEPYRGCHIFTYALPLLQKMRPNVQVVIVGADGVSYGAKPPKGTTYRKLFMNNVKDKVDMSKIHFTGPVPYDHFIKLLQISAAHVYLTYPFVLSWSMLEAMSAGAMVIGSNTAPVMEVLEHGKNGLLVDFFSSKDLAETIAAVLEEPEKTTEMRAAARQTIIDKYELNAVCLPRQTEIIEALANGRKPQ